MNTLRYVLSLILGIALPYAAQRWDRGRLPPRIRAGAWNTASWAAALYGFGPLSMIGWLWVTRHDFWTWQRRDGLLVALLRSAALLLAGALAAGVLLAMIVGVDALIGALVGAPE
jgi:hypothetical protein